MTSIEAELRDHIFYIGNGLLEPGGKLIDINTGNGLVSETFISACPDDQEFILCNAHPLVYSRYKQDKRVTVFTGVPASCDLYTSPVSLTLSVLALGHFNLLERLEIVEQIYEGTRPNGGLILVEQVQSDFEDFTPAFNGAAKASSRHFYLPNYRSFKARHIANVIKDSGFSRVDCFYRSYNIAAWLALKGE